MGFLDILSSIWNTMVDYTEDMQTRVDKYESKSNEELIKLLKGSSITEKDKSACRIILERRKKELEKSRENTQ